MIMKKSVKMIKESYCEVWKQKYKILGVFLLLCVLFTIGHFTKDEPTPLKETYKIYVIQEVAEYVEEIREEPTKADKFIASSTNIFFSNLKVSLYSFLSGVFIIPALYVIYLNGYLGGAFKATIGYSTILVIAIDYLILSTLIVFGIKLGIETFKSIFKKIKEKKYKELFSFSFDKEDLMYVKIFIFFVLPLLILGAIVESLFIII